MIQKEKRKGSDFGKREVLAHTCMQARPNIVITEHSVYEWAAVVIDAQL